MNKSKQTVLSSVMKSTKVKSSKSSAVPNLMKDRISSAEYQNLREVFSIFDEDGSGTIDPKEISKVLEQLGLDKRTPFVLDILVALRDKNKILNFDQFVETVCSKIGETHTKDGLKKIFNLYDKEQTGQIGFDQIKEISRFIGQNLTDEDIFELLHSVFINNKTRSNESLNFEEFYQIISQYYTRRQL